MNIRQQCREVRDNLDLRLVIEDWYAHPLDKQGRGTCPFCEGTNKTKFRIVDKRGYACAGCEEHGDVLSFIRKKENCSLTDALAIVTQKVGTDPSGGEKRSNPAAEAARTASFEEQGRWIYLAEDGTEAYTIVRYGDPETGKKDFKPFCKGRMGLSSDKRILYNLNVIANLTDQTTYITEGEKCADAMTGMGYVATCNPFGCGQWKEEFGYARYFEGRKVVIMPDADEQGDKWCESVMADFKGKIDEARVIRLPKTWVRKNRQFKGHDISDYLEVEGEEKAKAFIAKAERNADVWMRGFQQGISCTPLQAYNKYLELMDAGNFNVLDFSMWIPSVIAKARRGDLVCLLGGTGVGKSRLLMNMMYDINNVNYIVFDLELGRETVGERWCGLHNDVSVGQVQAAHALGKPYTMPDLSHIRIVPCGAKDMNFVRERIDAEEQIVGAKMDVAVIDYIGLMKGEGRTKTESLGATVEDFKGEMNNLGMTGVITSQRKRGENKEESMFECPSIFDNKDSSAIENSSQLLMAFWKQRQAGYLAGQVLKYSHGNEDEDPFMLRVHELRITEAREV